MLHPGYGFLSEQPRLAERCAEAGGRFVGPAPGALALFGDKTATRARAREIGLPMLAGTDADPPLAQAQALLREHGAVMVKAVAAGGGRGLRPVTSEAELAEAMRRCVSEATAAVGNALAAKPPITRNSRDRQRQRQHAMWKAAMTCVIDRRAPLPRDIMPNADSERSGRRIG